MSRFRGRQMWRHRVRNYVYRPDRSDRWFAWKKDPPMPDEDDLLDGDDGTRSIMSCYEFALVVEGFDMDDDATLDRLYETFDDVSAGSFVGRVTVYFVVEASEPLEALFTTLDRFTDAFPHVRVLDVLDGDR